MKICSDLLSIYSIPACFSSEFDKNDIDTDLFGKLKSYLFCGMLCMMNGIALTQLDDSYDITFFSDTPFAHFPHFLKKVASDNILSLAG